MPSFPPNILVICTDQHRHDFLGYRGADWIRTPNIDRIANRGTVFTHCFTNAPLCLPARTALASGIQPHRIGCLDNGSFFPLSHRTFYQRLRDYGYWTGYGGKLDLAKPEESKEPRYLRPDGLRTEDYAFGFCSPRKISVKVSELERGNTPYREFLEEKGLLELYIADRKSRVRPSGIAGVTPKPHLDSREVEMPDNWVIEHNKDSPLSADEYSDGYIGRYAVDWLESVGTNSPWFYQANFNGPHDPFWAPTEFAEKYRDAEVPAPIPADYTKKPQWVGRRFITVDEEQIRFTRRQYSACIESIDAWIGRMLDVLEERGLAEEMIVIFTSDHGEMLGDFGLYTKQLPYESSIRVPLSICGPGIASGRESDALVEWIDLNATICELAGLPRQENIDAISLVPVLDNSRDSHRENILSALSHFRCLRTERWKYVRSHNDIEELYDLLNDPEELNNLAPTEGEASRVRAELSHELDLRWREGMWRR